MNLVLVRWQATLTCCFNESKLLRGSFGTLCLKKPYKFLINHNNNKRYTFLQATRVRPQPQSCLHFQDFQGSEFLNRCLVVWPNKKNLSVFQWFFNIRHWHTDTAQKMKFSFKDLFSKCGQIRRKLRIWLHLLKKTLMENFIFLCSVITVSQGSKQFS